MFHLLSGFCAVELAPPVAPGIVNEKEGSDDDPVLSPSFEAGVVATLW